MLKKFCFENWRFENRCFVFALEMFTVRRVAHCFRFFFKLVCGFIRRLKQPHSSTTAAVSRTPWRLGKTVLVGEHLNAKPNRRQQFNVSLFLLVKTCLCAEVSIQA